MRYVFDINETLLDMSPLGDVLGGHENRVAWFDLLIRTALVRTAAGAFRPFGAIGTDAAESLGLGVEPADLKDAMASLPAHADVAPGLDSLRKAGHEVVALGNSAPDLIEQQLTNAGIRNRFDAVFSAETVEALKPSPIAYTSALDGPASDAVLVAAHDWDVAGASAAGLRTIFVDRGLRPALPGFTADRTVSDLRGLAST